jgi:hypothetical protein
MACPLYLGNDMTCPTHRLPLVHVMFRALNVAHTGPLLETTWIKGSTGGDGSQEEEAFDYTSTFKPSL